MSQEQSAAVKAQAKKKSSFFDITKHNAQRGPATEAIGGGLQGMQSNIPIRKPGKKLFFRVNPDPSYHLYDVAVIDDEDSGIHFIEPGLELPEEVIPLVTFVHIFACVTQHHKLFLWYMSATDTDWLKSALNVAKLAQSEWVRMIADRETSGYITYSAPPILQAVKPRFGTLTAAELFAKATEGRLIESADDPLIKKLMGLA
jgi:hypothetical protein